MERHSRIELRDLVVAARIGTYGPDDVVPDAHVLDLILVIDPQLVIIGEDSMARVFDYDPLIGQIDQIVRASHFQTQERLMTLLAEACAGHAEIEALELYLRKRPVLGGTGTLGVRLTLDSAGLAGLRESAPVKAPL